MRPEISEWMRELPNLRYWLEHSYQGQQGTQFEGTRLDDLGGVTEAIVCLLSRPGSRERRLGREFRTRSAQAFATAVARVAYFEDQLSFTTPPKGEGAAEGAGRRSS